jgi:hypothetical protein
MKQTAVEWLVQELTLPEYGDNPNWVKVAIQKAKEMEKEQLKDAYIIGRKGGTIKDFNETFKSE